MDVDTLAWITLGVMAALGLTNIVLMRQARNILISRHPDAYLKAELGVWVPGQGVRKLLFGIWGIGSSYRKLRDPELDRCVRNLWLFRIFAILTVAILIAVICALTDSKP